MTDPTPNPRYTLREAATLMRIAPATLGTMIRAGDVPVTVAFHAGGRYIIWRVHFDAWIGIAAPVAPRNAFIKRVDFDAERRAAS